MAKQAGDIRVIMTVDHLTYYKWRDQYYARSKSNLTGARWKRDECFAGSRRSAERLAGGSTLASMVYKTVDEHHRKYPLYCRLKTLAIECLKDGKDWEVTKTELKKAVSTLISVENIKPLVFKKHRLRRPVLVIAHDLKKDKIKAAFLREIRYSSFEKRRFTCVKEDFDLQVQSQPVKKWRLPACPHLAVPP